MGASVETDDDVGGVGFVFVGVKLYDDDVGVEVEWFFFDGSEAGGMQCLYCVD